MFDDYDKRAQLNSFDRDTLENRVLPTARRWVRDYPEGHNLHRHGRNTLEFWGELSEAAE